MASSQLSLNMACCRRLSYHWHLLLSARQHLQMFDLTVSVPTGGQAPCRGHQGRFWRLAPELEWGGSGHVVLRQAAHTWQGSQDPPGRCDRDRQACLPEQHLPCQDVPPQPCLRPIRFGQRGSARAQARCQRGACQVKGRDVGLKMRA